MSDPRKSTEIISDLAKLAEEIRNDDGPEPNTALVHRSDVEALAKRHGKTFDEMVRLLGDASDPFWGSF